MDEFVSKFNLYDGDNNYVYVKDLRTIHVINVKNYGAVGDGVTDDTEAINNAIADLTDFSRLYFPSGVYCVSDTIVIGNGDEAQISSVNGISIIGDGYETPSVATANEKASTIKYVGNVAKNTFEIHGPISEVEISNITFDGNRISPVALLTRSIQRANIHDITVKNATSIGWHLAMFTGIVSHTRTINNIFGVFRNIYAWCPFDSGSTCIQINGYNSNLVFDTNMSVFENLWTYHNGTGGCGIKIGFCDASTFINIIDMVNGASDGNDSGVLLVGEVNNFPDSLTFVNCAAHVKTTGNIGFNYFLPFHVGDGETIVDNPKLIGFDTKGKSINSLSLNWKSITPETEWAGSSIKYAWDFAGNLCLSATLSISTITNGSVIGTIPDFPTSVIDIPILCSDNNGNSHIGIRIRAADGKIFVNNPLASEEFVADYLYISACVPVRS